MQSPFRKTTNAPENRLSGLWASARSLANPARWQMGCQFSKLPRTARSWAALWALFFSISHLGAQPAGTAIPGRWLLIFDTSAEMKRRLPAVQTELNTLLASALGGRLQPGDSIGVWTFDETLRTGELPLLYWAPQDAATIADTINRFISKQRYTGQTRWAVLQPLLNRVAQNSPRLTVLIFCDGEGVFAGTPYDEGVNRIFQQRQAEQKKARQPLVVVLRSQQGRYTGCTVNFPPGMIKVPDFPPWPQPPAPRPAPPPAPPSAPTPRPTGPPLVIVGTNVESGPALSLTIPVPAAKTPAPAVPTNPLPAAVSKTPALPAESTNFVAMTNSIVLSNPPPPAKVVEGTNFLSASTPRSLPLATSAPPANPVAPANVVLSSNGVAEPAENSGSAHRGAWVAAVGVLLAAGVLTTFAIFRTRRADRSSLITRTMNRK